MIQLSPRGAALYQFLTLIVLLLALYAIGFCLSAFLELPVDPMAEVLEPAAVSQITLRLFKLTVLSGLVGAGLMMAGEGLSAGRVKWLLRLWTALVVISVALSPFNLDWALDLAAALILLLVLAASIGGASVNLRLWQIGLALIAVSGVAAYLLDGRAAEALRAFQIQVACPIAGLSVMFWLMRRYSRVEADWAEDGLKIVAALIFLAGSLISLGRVGAPPVISLAAAALVPLCYIILAGHSYRALASRNNNASLAPHWIALATLFWLIGGGFLGTLSIQPAISEAMRGTDLAEAQDWLARWVLLAIALAFVNETASSLRGDNRRVTGYMPLWLTAFGAGLATICQACRGVAQIYLRDVALVAPSAMAELLQPLTVVWIICLSAAAAGSLIYALGFWLRRPRIRVVED
ncbi:MAG: hypothetical protein OXN88_07510 [Chloroflexota bacterium]|nr:hypothetical protein [Chloroflexota bacterium]